MSNSAPSATGTTEPIGLATRFIMLTGGMVVMMALSAVTPVLTQIEAALAVTANDRLLVKMLVTVIGFTMVVGAPLTGFLTDRLGFRRLLVAASIVYTVAGTAGLYLSDLYALLASRLLVGLAAASIATMAMTLINTRLDGVDRARWMGYHVSTSMFGSLLVHPLIGALGEIGWRWPFAIFGFGLIIGIVALVGFREPPRPERPVAAEAPVQGGNVLRWFPLWFIPLALVMGTVTYIPNVYLPFVVKEAGVTSPAIIAAVMLGDAVIGACMSLLFGRSQRFLSSEAAFMVSFGCVGTGMLLVSLASGLAGIVVGMLVFGFGLGWFVPNLMYSLARRVTKLRQGRAVGIVKAAHYIAAPLGILAVEPVSRAAGPHGVMLTARSCPSRRCWCSAASSCAGAGIGRHSGKELSRPNSHHIHCKESGIVTGAAWPHTPDQARQSRAWTRWGEGRPMRWCLSEFLNLLELRSQCWCFVDTGADSGVRAPASETVYFYAMLEGRAKLSGVPDGPVPLEEGAIAMVLSGNAHAIRPHADAETEAVPFLTEGHYADSPPSYSIGDGPRAARMLCGRLKVRWPGGLNVGMLPPSLLIEPGVSMVNMTAMLGEIDRSGAASVLTRAAALLLTSALRDHPDCQAMFRDAHFRDPIGRAIQYMEVHPFRDWTVASLARKVGLGRSTFAARFLNEAGKAPMEVLTDVRMRIAATLLTETRLKVSEIGERVGYRSESAFSRRFVAYYNSTPGQMRHGRGAALASPSAHAGAYGTDARNA